MKALLAIALSASAIFLISCETTKHSKIQDSSSLELNSMIGHMTASQAIAQYGQPDQVQDLGNGHKTYVWEHSKLEESSGPVMFNTSNPQNITSYRAGTPQLRKVRYTLTFDENNILQSYRNY